MIVHATKYTPVPRRTKPSGGVSAALKSGKGPTFKVRKPKAENVYQWWHREMKEGNSLHRYFEKVRHAAPKRWRQVARMSEKFKQNNQSDLRVLAHVPLNDFLRWRQVDPHFWEDDNNLRSLRRDNDDLRHCIKV